MELRANAPSSPGVDGWLVSKRYAWYVFALTFLIMVFDFIDRQIVVSMFPALKAEWSLSDKELGALLSVVSITVGFGALPIALLADRWSRVKSIAAMASVWSLATISCAFAGNYGQLFAARSLIGLGEAGYGPVGSALISSIFPARIRAGVLSALIAAATIGGVIGVVLGGVLTARWGWRAAFGIVGIPGLILALLYLFVRDYKTVGLTKSDAVGATVKMTPRDIAASVFRAPSAVLVYIATALQLFVVATLYAWLPSFLNRAYGLPVDQAGAKAAVVLLVGSLGAVVWGYLADRISRKRPYNRLLLCAFCAIGTCATLTYAFGSVPPGDQQFLLIALGGFLMTGTLGASYAVVIDVTHPGLRATATAVLTFIQNVFGQAAGPFIAGALSDSYGLSSALALVPLFCVAASALYLASARFYQRDLGQTEKPDISPAGLPLLAVH
jgi:MFS transporter, Spinster family, sphingosine-1-phosphate transporter